MKIAYCDCFSGISGDMFLGALVDAGLPVENLEKELLRLGLPEKFHLSATQVKKGAISASLVQIIIDEDEIPLAQIPVVLKPITTTNRVPTSTSMFMGMNIITNTTNTNTGMLT